MLDDPYHVDIVRDKLTRMIPLVLPDVVDELAVVLPEYIPTGSTSGWCPSPLRIQFIVWLMFDRVA